MDVDHVTGASQIRPPYPSSVHLTWQSCLCDSTPDLPDWEVLRSRFQKLPGCRCLTPRAIFKC